ncbi:MAG: hypothetical protein RJP95_01140 [Pirellulales bacterium]
MPLNNDHINESHLWDAKSEALMETDEFRREVVRPVSNLLRDWGMPHNLDVRRNADGTLWAFFTKGHLGDVTMTLTPDPFHSSDQSAVVWIKWQHARGSTVQAVGLRNLGGYNLNVEDLIYIAEKAVLELDEASSKIENTNESSVVS